MDLKDSDENEGRSQRPGGRGDASPGKYEESRSLKGCAGQKGCAGVNPATRGQIALFSSNSIIKIIMRV